MTTMTVQMITEHLGPIQIAMVVLTMMAMAGPIMAMNSPMKEPSGKIQIKMVMETIQME